MRKLTFEEELRLSDLLVKRREIRDRACDHQGVRPQDVNMKLLTSEDRRGWRKGDEAAGELIQAYLPYIHRAANQIASKFGLGAATIPSTEDVIQEGIAGAFAATWAYNLRGGGGRYGRRFTQYAGPHIKKYMQRLCIKEKSPYRLDINVISATYVWRATETALRDELGRSPTEKEIRENLYTEGAKNTKLEPGLPLRSSFADIDDPLREDVGKDSNRPVATIISDLERGNNRLASLLQGLVSDHVVRLVLIMVGADDGVPKDDPQDMADKIGGSRAAGKKALDRAHVALIHPAFRGRIRKKDKDNG